VDLLLIILGGMMAAIILILFVAESWHGCEAIVVVVALLAWPR
jgi:hypothetical protein